MGCSGLLVLGFILTVAHCLEMLGVAEKTIIEIRHNITAVLGEDVYLSCRYLGESEIQSGEWKRHINSKVKSKRLAGVLNGKPFSRYDFSEPDSLTNLTVKTKVSSVEAEGEYMCEFASEEEIYSDSLFLTVIAQPDIQIRVSAETLNGSHYQSVSCSAVGGRPVPQISWLLGGHPPSDFPFTVDMRETQHSNGTSSLSSILRFPTHLQDEDHVTCVVQHPTLPNPELTTVRVETYARPNVSIKAEMVQRGGSDFWVVSCVSSGGRPDADIALALSSDEADADMQTSSVVLPATLYEGFNITCVFYHPKFTLQVSRVITLPSFYLSAHLLHSNLGNNSNDFEEIKSLEVEEGQRDTVIGLQVEGNVPHYNITCQKDDRPLPSNVKLVGSNLTVQDAVEHHHAGLYECLFSYHHVNASLRFNITVKSQTIKPVPPTIRVDLQTGDGRSVIECSAADAVPAANMSWLLPEGVTGVSWFNFTSHNGSHSVRGVLLLPACSPQELTAECVINHPALEEPQNRSVTLPICARPNITINSRSEWKDGDEYRKVDCSVDSVAPAATVTWHVGNTIDSISYPCETEVQADGLVSTRSSVYFLSSLYSGQTLTCTVEHPSLEAPEKRTIDILVQKAPLLNVSLVRQQDSPLWLALCDIRGEGVGSNLAWILPENAKDQISLDSQYEGQVVKARLTYRFPLALHEGQDLTCVYHFEHGATEKKTVHVPRYYISSVRVLNHTTPLQSRYGGEPIAHRLALQENHHHHQRVVLRVEGNVPEYSLGCNRSDGALVQMDGVVMVFQSELTELDEGLYSCRASFYHHTATVNIQVEVTSSSKQLELAALVCMSSALAIILILVTVLWVCCKGNNRAQYKKKESLSALTSLMNEPGSPEVKKSAETQDDREQINYTIIFDLKSTV